MKEGKCLSSTHWSVVLAAQDSDADLSRAALSALCEKYWPPPYAYLRRKGYPEEEARDMTQAFFARFLEKNYVHDASQQKGRFRSFFVACLNHFLANEWDAARAQKRGGRVVRLALDEMAPYEPADDMTPETAYERQWALSLLKHVLDRLKAEYIRAGKEAEFEALSAYLPGGPTPGPYVEPGKRIGMSEGAIKVAVHRLRKHYREVLRDEVAQTLADKENVDQELRNLMSVL